MRHESPLLITYYVPRDITYKTKYLLCSKKLSPVLPWQPSPWFLHHLTKLTVSDTVLGLRLKRGEGGIEEDEPAYACLNSTGNKHANNCNTIKL